MLSPGQQADITLAKQLLEKVPAKYVLGNKAFDADDLSDELKKSGKKVVVPPK